MKFRILKEIFLVKMLGETWETLDEEFSASSTCITSVSSAVKGNSKKEFDLNVYIGQKNMPTEVSMLLFYQGKSEESEI